MNKIFLFLILIIIVIIGCKENPVDSQPVKPTVIISASLNNVDPGTPVTLSWSSSNAAYCIGLGFNTGNATSGSVVVNPRGTTTYSIFGVLSGGGLRSDTVSVTIIVKEIIGIGNYYQGGIIYFIDSTQQHGLIAAKSDLPMATWEDAKKSCNDLVINGFDDWFLPDINQLELLWFQRDKVGGFLFYANPNDPNGDLYWSSTPLKEGDTWIRCVSWHNEPKPMVYHYGIMYDKWFVRPIRKF